MAAFTIDEGKIKLAWREKYVTDGANERNLDSPRGAYRGFWLYSRPVSDTFLRFLLDPYIPTHNVDKDQFAVYADRTSGFSVSIREEKEFEIDCAAMFPVGMAAEDWYVYIEAAYTPNVTTTANYRVETTDPHDPLAVNYDPDAVILGVIPMPALSIAFPAFGTWPLAGMYDRRCIPSPTARQAPADFVDGDEPWGFFDGVSKWCLGTGDEARAFAEPTVETYAGLVGVTKFQLSGEYFVGLGAVGTAAKHFRLMIDLANVNAPLLGSDGGWLYVAAVYQSDGVTPLTPSADADTEGFYTDPWIEIGFVHTADVSFTGTARVLCYIKETLLTLDNAPAGAFPVGDIEVRQHAANVAARLFAGVPSSLAVGTAETQLAALLGLVNARIQTTHYQAAPADWVLLWRSHNLPANTGATKDTCSLYFGAKGIAYIIGGFIDLMAGPTYGQVIAGPGDAAKDVVCFYMQSGSGSLIVQGIKDSPAAMTAWALADGWDYYTSNNKFFETMIGSSFIPSSGILWPDFATYPNAFNLIYPDAGSALDYRLYEQANQSHAGFARARRYFSQRGMQFTSNCSNDGTGNWLADVDNDDAFMVQITPAGVFVCKKHQDDIVLGVPWTDLTWTTRWKIGTGEGAAQASLACMSVYGELYEIVRIGWSGVADSIGTYWGGGVYNFRNKHEGLPAHPIAGDFSLGGVYTDFANGLPATPFQNAITAAGGLSFVINDIDAWGFAVNVVIVSGVAGNFGNAYSFDAQAIIET